MTVATALIVWAVQGAWGLFYENASGPPELKVHAPNMGGCSHVYYDSSPQELKRLKPDLQNPSESGGVHVMDDEEAHEISVSAALQAKADRAIIVDKAEVRVLSSRQLPRKGTIVAANGCGAGLDERAFNLDFRRDPVSVEPKVQRTAQGGVMRSRDFPFKVSASDPEYFTFNVKNVRRDIRFEIVIHWISEGESGTTRLNNGGSGYHAMGLPKRVPLVQLPDLLS